MGIEKQKMKQKDENVLKKKSCQKKERKQQKKTRKPRRKWKRYRNKWVSSFKEFDEKITRKEIRQEDVKNKRW